MCPGVVLDHHQSVNDSSRRCSRLRFFFLVEVFTISCAEVKGVLSIFLLGVGQLSTSKSTGIFLFYQCEHIFAQYFVWGGARA